MKPSRRAMLGFVLAAGWAAGRPALAQVGPTPAEASGYRGVHAAAHRGDATQIASVADDEETLRLLLSLGASAKQVTSRYDGTCS
jgi:hypothetical protein